MRRGEQGATDRPDSPIPRFPDSPVLKFASASLPPANGHPHLVRREGTVRIESPRTTRKGHNPQGGTIIQQAIDQTISEHRNRTSQNTQPAGRWPPGRTRNQPGERGGGGRGWAAGRAGGGREAVPGHRKSAGVRRPTDGCHIPPNRQFHGGEWPGKPRGGVSPLGEGDMMSVISPRSSSSRGCLLVLSSLGLHVSLRCGFPPDHVSHRAVASDPGSGRGHGNDDPEVQTG
jgi:hypothetical protein